MVFERATCDDEHQTLDDACNQRCTSERWVEANVKTGHRAGWAMATRKTELSEVPGSDGSRTRS